MNFDVSDMDDGARVAGLRDTRALRGAIEALYITALHLARAVDGSVKGLNALLKVARSTARLSKILRAAEIYNLNVRRRAWVLSCPQRRLWLRGLIGTARIARWHKRREALASGMWERPASERLGHAALSLPQPKMRLSRTRNWYQLTAQYAPLGMPNITPISMNASMNTKIASLAITRFGPSRAGQNRTEFTPYELTEDYVYTPAPHAPTMETKAIVNKQNAKNKETIKPTETKNRENTPKPKPP